MMNPALPKELALIGLFVVANCVIATPLIKLFARSLSLKEAFIISSVAFGPTSIALAAYFVAKIFLDLPKEIDGLATVAALSVAGIIATSQARRYGIQKAGWLGVGAKTVITLVVVSWLLFAINLTTHVLT